ncbi:MAG: glycoside hydrolase family 3 N-terminal domain-containing protein [Planctomycetota bacterium]|jgi:beta-glucosidase-like glycosyl hydrolase
MTNTRLLMPALRLAEGDLREQDVDAALRLAERGVGGFCIYGGDRGLPALAARLQEAAPHPLLIASDMEEGAGQQVAGLPLHPPAAALDADAAEAAGVLTAMVARPLGITMTFAPVCDVVSHPRNPIIQGRAFPDPARCAARFVEGARLFGLRTCAKHFPGHGATAADSHDALPVVDDSGEVLRSRDLPPFQSCIEAGVDAVMTAHVAYPALTGSRELPATLSRSVTTDLLRKELGFRGLVVTDALLMEGVRAGRTEPEAARLALEAGCDLLLCPDDLEGVLEAVARMEAGASLERIAAAARPLEGTLDRAARLAVHATGELPVGPGDHPLQICELAGEGRGLAAAAGVAFERYNASGELLESGGEGGLAVSTVALLRRDRAWAGPLELPPFARAMALRAGLLILLGPEVLGEGIEVPCRVHSPGMDPLTLQEVVRRALGREIRLPWGIGAGFWLE